MTDVTTFAVLVLQAMPGNMPTTIIHNTVEIRIFAGEGACSFGGPLSIQEGTGPGYVPCVDRVTSIARVLVDGKVVAEIPASAIPQDALKILYDQLSSLTLVDRKALERLQCLSNTAPLHRVECHE